MTWRASDLPGGWRAHRRPDVPIVEAQFDGRLRGTMLVALNYSAVDCR
jgi:hypothetical protein